MPRMPNWIWVERIFEKSPKFNYKVISTLIGFVIFLAYAIFIHNDKFRYLHWDTYTLVAAFALSLLITIQLAGINYFLKDIRASFRIIDEIYLITENVFLNSTNIYIITSLTLIGIFIFLDFKNETLFPALFNDYGSKWYLIFDVYNHTVSYFMLLLLAVNVWIVFNISSSLNKIKHTYPDIHLKINLYDSDHIGGLSQIRNFITNYLVYYFICISLAIISYFNPFNQFGSYYTIILASLLLLGLYLFFIGIKFISVILNNRVKYVTDIVNKQQEDYRNKFMNFDFENGCTRDMACTSILLINTYNERQLIDTINKQGYDFTTFVYLVGSLISPILSVILSTQKP